MNENAITRRKLAKAIEKCLTSGLDASEIGDMVSEQDNLPDDLLQECFLVAKVGEMYKCFPVKGIQAKTLEEINLNRMYSGEGSGIELEELDLSQLCHKAADKQKM